MTWVPTAIYSRKIFSRCEGLQSVLELGCNIGLNLDAIKLLKSATECSGVEINENAAREARAKGHVVRCEALSSYAPERQFDLVFTKGVLIHIDPGQLPEIYDLMYRASAKYLLICEYYYPTPVTVPYRGHDDVLFKRDFAGEMMDRLPLALIDYGFIYHRDTHFPADDINWFLLRKS